MQLINSHMFEVLFPGDDSLSDGMGCGISSFIFSFEVVIVVLSFHDAKEVCSFKAFGLKEIEILLLHNEKVSV